MISPQQLFIIHIFYFLVLDSKVPKSEDIDEEDDDVPGRIILLNLNNLRIWSIFYLIELHDDADMIFWGGGGQNIS